MIKDISNVRSKNEARQIAIDWQTYSSQTNSSYGELAIHSTYFYNLGKKFRLVREFKENGII